MLETLAREIVAPIGRRLGTLVGGALAGYGITAEEFAPVAGGIVAALGIAVDLLVVYVRHRSMKGR